MFDHQGLTFVLEKSGLSKSEAGFLYGVSRQTIYNWIAGGCPTQSFIVNHADATTKGVKAAIQRGLLPFPASLTPSQRRKRLNEMVQKLHVLAKPSTIESK